MDLKEVLTTEIITLNIQATEKEDILAELIDILVQAGQVSDKEAALNAVLNRERQMSTGIQAGVAIPHGKVEGLSHIVACIGISKEGKDFDALDGKPSNIFVLTLSPAEKTGPHVQFLSEISRLLTQSSIREEILAAKTKEEVLATFLQ